MSQLTVSRASGHRPPYDDPASLEEMFGDCEAAGRNLATHPGPVARRRPTPLTLEVPVETAGSLKARLVMKWTLGPIESLFVTEERVLLATGFVLLVMLVLLARRLP